MTRHTVPVSKKDVRIALAYVLGELNRAEVNRAYKLNPISLTGLHRVGRAMRQVIQEHPDVLRVMHRVRDLHYEK